MLEFVTKTIYDPIGNVVRVIITPNLSERTGEIQNSFRYEYDDLDNHIRTISPTGRVMAYVKDVEGITHEYDPDGNLLKTVRPEEYAKSGRNGAGISYTYDEENHLTGIYDDKGNPFRSFVYDEKGRLIKSTEGTASCGTKYVYDPAGRLTEKWVPVREVNNTDDANKTDAVKKNIADDTGKSKTEDNRICKVLYNVTLYTYDAAGNRILERRSPDEVEEGKRPAHYLDIRMSYDKQNRLVRVEDSLGAAVRYTYDCLNNRLTEKYRVNESSYRLICYKYDAAGRLIERMESVDLADVGRKESPYRKKEFLRTKFIYDKNGNIMKTVLPNGGEVNRKYDIMDRVIRENIRDKKSGINKTIHYAYDAAGKLTSRTDDDGNVHAYAYDTCGRLLSETDEEGGTTRYFHNKNNELIKAVNADHYDSTKDDGAGYTFTYDIFGRMKEVRDAYGNLCESDEYDAAGRIKSRHDGAGLIFRNEYDTGGRKTSIYTDESDSPVQTYTYDSLGNITGTTDGEANHTAFELDAWGRIVSIQMPDGSRESYTYDHAGNITTTTDGNGNTITYTYNSMMNLSRVTDRAGNPDTFTCDGEGNTVCHTDRNGKEIRSEYGSFGILLSEHATDGTFHTCKYDTQGRLIENASNHVTYRYDYTKTGRLRTKYINGKAALTYTYTKAGKVASITDISGKTTTYGYDQNGNLTKVSEAGKDLATYAYDAINRIQKIRFANGITTGYTYDTERNLASLETTDKEGKRLISYTYQYDRNGNRTKKKDHVKESHVTTYAYDSMQRLSGVTYPQAGTERYIYDAVGNRIEKRVERSVEYTAKNPVHGDITDYTERYSYDACNRLTAKSVWENGNEKPTDTTTYTYDAQGSLLSEKSMDICKKYLYNDLHQCIRTEIIRGKEEEAERAVLKNIYDGEGLRYSVIENGRRTDFVTNGWENLAELDENGKVTKRILRGNGIVASEDKTYACQDNTDTAKVLNTTYHYYHGNERMDVEYITDEAGTVVNSYEYDAFGSITFFTEKLQNRYTYNGEAYDKATEQYYLRKRFYNSKLCRFTQEDEYRGDGLNLYAFCTNNPVMYVDPSGYKSKKCASGNDNESGSDTTKQNLDLNYKL